MSTNGFGVLRLFIFSFLIATGCSSSNDSGNQNPAGEQPLGDGTTAGDTTAGDTTAGDTTAGDTTAGDTTAGDTTAGDTTAGDTTAGDTTAGDTTAGDTTAGDTTAGDTTAGDTTAGDTTGGGTTGGGAPTNGVDLSGGDDDSPTTAESLSLQGPFIKDTSRSPGPPSTPTDLTLLLNSENWNEMTWAPSSDDQSVEEYEIYRDGQLIASVRGDSGYEFDYRRWISTSVMDCDYTHYADCSDKQPTPGSSYEYTVVAIDNEGMRSAPSEPATYTFEPIRRGPVNLDGYSKVFEENFNESSLSRERWKTALPWGENETINGEQQYFVNIFGNNPPAYDPFVFTGETLQITGIETPASMAAQANGQPYMSGAITTADHFEMTYGYVEMSAKVAAGQGLLSTFYLFNQSFEKNKPEIDIMEFIGSRPEKSYQTYHYYDSNRARYGSGEKHSSPTMETDTGTNLTAGFHTYAALWEPGLVIWYIDGVEVRRITGPRVSDEPMNIIAQLVVGSIWIGSPDPAAIPAVFEIDYIRAWQKN